MKFSIYIETSIVSYLTARPNRDLVRAAHQEVTREWWVTWNCTHIANATMRPKIESICRASGFEPPVICTPLELVEE